MGKKLVMLVFALVLCLGMLVAPAQAEVFTTRVVLPDSMSALNVRSGEGTGYSVVTWVKDGTKIELLSAGTVWAKIKVVSSGKSGYIKTIYLEEAARSATTPKGYKTSIKLPSTMSALNVRSGPSTSYKSLGVVKHGDGISIEKVGDVWSQIKVTASGKTGYIKNLYIDQLNNDPDYTPPTTGTPKYGRVTGDEVRLRRGPGTRYASQESLKKDTKLLIWDTEVDWHYVSTQDGLKGWISGAYVVETAKP